MLPHSFDTVIFALETSTSQASMALSIEGTVVSKREWTAERSHNSRIFDLLEEVKPLLDKNPPQLILVGAGPGSYSGVRVALAVADGLALAYGSRVVAVPSWEALPIQNDLALVLSDARRGGWAVAELINGEMKDGIQIISPEEVPTRSNSILEKGGELLSCEDSSKLESKNWPPYRADLVPIAEGLLTAWLNKSEESQANLLQTSPSPLYVRDPHITPAKRALWEKAQTRQENSN